MKNTKINKYTSKCICVPKPMGNEREHRSRLQRPERSSLLARARQQSSVPQQQGHASSVPCLSSDRLASDGLESVQCQGPFANKCDKGTIHFTQYIYIYI